MGFSIGTIIGNFPPIDLQHDEVTTSYSISSILLQSAITSAIAQVEPKYIMYSRPHEMEPLLPNDRDGRLEALAVETVRRSAALGSVLHPITRVAVVELLRQMNSYYSNLIEGHNTHPLAIEKALRKDYSHEPAKRALQLESLAHIEVQKIIEQRLDNTPEINICSPDFLCWIHEEFYKRMPPEFCEVQDEKGNKRKFDPGKFRDALVEVGAHIPPDNNSLPDFLKRFSDFYNPSRLREIDRIVAIAASHHRLAWIHPFFDGNGRVTRLFTHAFLIRAKIDGHRLWTVTRGLARRKDEYMANLVTADQPRRGDLDGRGNLSDRGLYSFCEFFLTTALDQISFMTELLELDKLQDRIGGYISKRAAARELDSRAVYLITDTLLRGEVPRGDASRITGKGERMARDLVSQLLQDGLLTSDSPKGPLRFGLPVKAVGYYFPRLYPEGIEVSLDQS